jgi:hypothetical protein
MEKTIIKFITGLSTNATKWKKRQHKQYGGIANICKQIDYDVKHGATIEDVRLIVQKIRNDSNYSSLQKDEESMQRLDELDKQFLPSKEEMDILKLPCPFMIPLANPKACFNRYTDRLSTMHSQ